MGRKLAEKIRWPFVDLDEKVTEQAGMSIREIFEKHGEPGFRKLESEHLPKVLRLQNHIISLGGGAVLAEENRREIKSAKHHVVYLKATPDELHRRIIADPATSSQRPGLTHLGGSVDEVRVLLAQREPLYQELKTIELDVNFLPTEMLVAQLQSLLPK